MKTALCFRKPFLVLSVVIISSCAYGGSYSLGSRQEFIDERNKIEITSLVLKKDVLVVENPKYAGVRLLMRYSDDVHNGSDNQTFFIRPKKSAEADSNKIVSGTTLSNVCLVRESTIAYTGNFIVATILEGKFSGDFVINDLCIPATFQRLDKYQPNGEILSWASSRK